MIFYMNMQTCDLLNFWQKHNNAKPVWQMFQTSNKQSKHRLVGQLCLEENSTRSPDLLEKRASGNTCTAELCMDCIMYFLFNVILFCEFTVNKINKSAKMKKQSVKYDVILSKSDTDSFKTD